MLLVYAMTYIVRLAVSITGVEVMPMFPARPPQPIDPGTVFPRVRLHSSVPLSASII